MFSNSADPVPSNSLTENQLNVLTTLYSMSKRIALRRRNNGVGYVTTVTHMQVHEINQEKIVDELRKFGILVNHYKNQYKIVLPTGINISNESAA